MHQLVEGADRFLPSGRASQEPQSPISRRGAVEAPAVSELFS